ncbi:MAG: sigma-70 family RNA polymerase sigma factor [Planctomycetaceae bacterium]|nr:sigma-70 family RNA polymerase sigma factor [Planctomycetaceae bacterium]
MDREPEQIADEWLVLSAQGGSSAAMEALVKRWQPKLLAHARQVTGHRDAARDVVQESWLTILKTLDQLRDPAAFRGWVYRIVHGRAVDWVRRTKRQRDAIQKQAKEPIQTEDTPTEDLADERQALAEAMKHLTPEEKLLLRMYYLERMRIKEIATSLQLPEGTIKYRLFELRKNLKTLVEGECHA